MSDQPDLPSGDGMRKPFLLAVITRPDLFAGEAGLLEGLLEAGLEKLHIRKPGATRQELEFLLAMLPDRWYSRIVLHGMEAQEIALQYGIPQIHGPVRFADGYGMSGGGGAEVGPGGRLAVSTSVHSGEELSRLPGGLSYSFISPFFDSISKPGYIANGDLLMGGGMYGRSRCRAIGLGGIQKENIGQVVEAGWDGAAVLGAVWERPEAAVGRFENLQKIIGEYERGR